jgi:ParB family chromosome partitioning protein
MRIDAANAELKSIRVDEIDRNRENPRIHFRQKEMDELMESIAIHGVQVPISVHREKDRYVLLDGERRWRSALKLNLKTIPALVQDRPDRLTNLLLMFNIHSLREQWDLLTIATKLAVVIDLLAKSEGRRPTEEQISRHTGLPRGVIRRCRYLIDLPSEFQEQLQRELKKPKREQRLTEDFFIEMERALTTVERAMPVVVDDRSRIRRVLIKKFKSDVIDNRTHFRKVAKIARAARVRSNVPAARKALQKLFTDNSYSIEEAYAQTVEAAYSEKELVARLESLLQRLRHLRPEDIDPPLRRRLRAVIKVARSLLAQ